MFAIKFLCVLLLSSWDSNSTVCLWFCSYLFWLWPQAPYVVWSAWRPASALPRPRRKSPPRQRQRKVLLQRSLCRAGHRGTQARSAVETKEKKLQRRWFASRPKTEIWNWYIGQKLRIFTWRYNHTVHGCWVHGCNDSTKIIVVYRDAKMSRVFVLFWPTLGLPVCQPGSDMRASAQGVTRNTGHRHSLQQRKIRWTVQFPLNVLLCSAMTGCALSL